MRPGREPLRAPAESVVVLAEVAQPQAALLGVVAIAAGHGQPRRCAGHRCRRPAAPRAGRRRRREQRLRRPGRSRVGCRISVPAIRSSWPRRRFGSGGRFLVGNRRGQHPVPERVLVRGARPVRRTPGHPRPSSGPRLAQQHRPGGQAARGVEDAAWSSTRTGRPDRTAPHTSQPALPRLPGLRVSSGADDDAAASGGSVPEGHLHHDVPGLQLASRPRPGSAEDRVPGCGSSAPGPSLAGKEAPGRPAPAPGPAEETASSSWSMIVLLGMIRWYPGSGGGGECSLGHPQQGADVEVAVAEA